MCFYFVSLSLKPKTLPFVTIFKILNTSFDRPSQELLNACFSFGIGSCMCQINGPTIFASFE